MSTFDSGYKLGIDVRNERFSFAFSMDLRGGDDLVTTGNLISVSRFVTIVGGKGNDIIQIFFDGSTDYEVANNAGSVIFGDTGRESDLAAEGSGTDHILGFSGVDTIFAGGGDDYVNAHNGNDDVYGGAGNDYLLGGNGADTIEGDAGDDIIYGGSPASVSWPFHSIVINYNGDDDTLIAPETRTGHVGLMATTDASADTLKGGAGDDYLDGGGGSDLMYGGLGNDTYIVSSTGDVVDEVTTGAGGTDTVRSTLSFSLANTGVKVKGAFENLTLIGTGATNGTGNSLNNTIVGNGAANSLNGGAGNDILNGKLGNDILTGSAGTDVFVFDTALNATTNFDNITDFSVPSDTIHLDNAVMAGLGATLGTLHVSKFWMSTSGLAHDATDRIIYETDTGKLYYDPDGTGAGARIQFAGLAPNLPLTNADFAVI